MNISADNSNSTSVNCSLEGRVYTPSYLWFRLINWTYLRVLIGPGILLNSLCLLVLSRPRLSNPSTTIVFLRFLALFDILAISLKYLRAEINYQSIEKHRQSFLLTPASCKTIYVLMNTSISMAMWTIVLMSLDKAIAVSYPLKSSIWLTHKRVFYICCSTIVILILANLPFILLAGIAQTGTKREYCSLEKNWFIVDLVTASILPIGLITGANIVIAVVLRRTSKDWSIGEQKRASTDGNELNLVRNQLSLPNPNYRSTSGSTTTTTDIVLAAKRRTNAQVTRMLLAVTLTLIICNIPNTIYSVSIKIYDTRKLLLNRSCSEITDREIILYKVGFYASIFQDILSDLPHIVNFFLYCLAGKKFRMIFLTEVFNILSDCRIFNVKRRRLTQASAYPINIDLSPGECQPFQANRKRGSSNSPIFISRRNSVDILFQTSNNQLNKTNSRQSMRSTRNSSFFSVQQ